MSDNHVQYPHHEADRRYAELLSRMVMMSPEEVMSKGDVMSPEEVMSQGDVMTPRRGDITGVVMFLKRRFRWNDDIAKADGAGDEGTGGFTIEVAGAEAERSRRCRRTRRNEMTFTSREQEEICPSNICLG